MLRSTYNLGVVAGYLLEAEIKQGGRLREKRRQVQQLKACLASMCFLTLHSIHHKRSGLAGRFLVRFALRNNKHGDMMVKGEIVRSELHVLVV